MDGILLVGHQLWIWDIKFEKIRCQNPYQPQNLKILLTFWGCKIPLGQNFWNLFIFTCKVYMTSLCRYHENKNQLGVTSSSKINLTIKLLIKLSLLA